MDLEFFGSLAALAVVIWLLTLVSSNIERHTPEKDGDSSENGDVKGYLSQIVDAIHTYRCSRAFDDRRTVVVLIVSGVFAFAAAVAAIYSAIVFHGQLREMQEEQRAWLSLKIVPTHLEVTRGRIGGPYIALSVAAKNVGKSPAREVTAWPIVHVPLGPEQGSFADLGNHVCVRFTMGGFAPLIVPGDTYTNNLLVLFTSDQIQNSWAPLGQQGRKAFNVLPIVCVVYRVSSDEGVHLMAAVTEIEKLTEDSSPAFRILGKYGD